MDQNSQTAYKQVREFLAKLRTDWQLPNMDWLSSTPQRLWTIRIAIVVPIVLVFVLVVINIAIDETLWAWLKVLIVPVTIAGGVAWFTQQEQKQQHEREQERDEHEALRAYLDQMGTLLREDGSA